MKKYYLLTISLLLILTSACKKEGQLILKPVAAAQPIGFRGFVVGNTLEQYFDGRKIREFYGNASYDGRIVFDSDEPILMELKKKGDDQVLYSAKIAKDASGTIKTMRFFYDGTKVTENYNYPVAKPGVEQIAFYFDFPADMPVDIVAGDDSGDVNNLHYLARNVQPKQWVDFLEIAPINGPDQYIFLLKAGTKEFLIKNDFFSSYIQGNIPSTGGWYQGGGVQSMYVIYNKTSDAVAAQNIIDSFPR